MKKIEFEQAVQFELREVPLEERCSWDETKLLVWFMNAKVKNPCLTWVRCPGDLWQWVSGMCKNLIGPSAL